MANIKHSESNVKIRKQWLFNIEIAKWIEGFGGERKMNSKNLPLSHATSLIRVSILYFLVVTGFSGEWLNYCLMMFHSSNSKTGYVSQIKAFTEKNKDGIWNKTLQIRKVEVNSYLGWQERAWNKGEREVISNKKLLERSFYNTVSSLWQWELKKKTMLGKKIWKGIHE